MTKLTGLELRKAACEAANGWTCVLFLPKFNGDDEGWIVTLADGSVTSMMELPAIESDPAVSEPIFLEWMKQNDCEVTMLIGSSDSHLETWITVHRVGKPDVKIYGATPSEARARAIVAGSRK